MSHTIKITLFPTVAHVNEPKYIEAAFPDFFDAPIINPNRDVLPAWSAAQYSSSRNEADVIDHGGIILDLDEGLYEPAITDAPFAVYAHTTYHHGMAGKGARWRALIPFAERVDTATWRLLRDACIKILGAKPDLQTSNCSHSYFVPGVASQSRVASYRLLSSSATRCISLMDVSVVEQPLSILKSTAGGVDLESIINAVKIRNQPSEFKARLLSILRGESVTPTPDGSRTLTLNNMVFNIAALEEAPPVEAMSEIFDLLSRSVVADADKSHSAWADIARKNYISGLKKTEKNKAERAAKRAKGQSVAVVQDWHSVLEWQERKDGSRKLAAKGINIDRVLANHPGFGRNIRFNVLTKDIDVLGGPLEGEPPGHLDTALSSWFEGGEFGVTMPRLEVSAKLSRHAAKNSYNPVAEYLGSLEWDGVQRLERLFVDYAETETDGSLPGGGDYKRLIARKFAIGAVARVLQAKSKVDASLVLIGGQGVGKTMFCSTLADPWYLMFKGDLANKDAILAATAGWIIELGELASMNRTDFESIKAFLTTEEDNVRLPYGRAMVRIPRTSVFVGTSNKGTPLKDETGDRRFVPITILKCHVAKLALDRDQIWAEAVALYRGNVTWVYSDAEERRLALERNHYTADLPTDTTAATIAAWATSSSRRVKLPYLTVREAASALEISPKDVPQHQSRIGQALRSLGCQSRKQMERGVTEIRYYLPDELLKKSTDYADRGDNDGN